MIAAITPSTERGTVKMFNDDRGFGFIAPDAGGKDISVHAKALRAGGMDTLHVCDKVTFERPATDRGERAENVRRV